MPRQYNEGRGPVLSLGFHEIFAVIPPPRLQNNVIRHQIRFIAAVKALDSLKMFWCGDNNIIICRNKNMMTYTRLASLTEQIFLPAES